MTKRKSPKDRQRERKGFGTTWEKPDGRFGAAITVSRRDPLTGRITKKRETTTKKTPEEADAWRFALYDDMAASGGVINGSAEDRSLREHLEAWLRDALEPRLAPNTLEKRIWAASSHIVPALGHLPVSSISPQDVQSLYAKLSREGYSLASRREVHVTLKQSLGQAVKWGLIDRNPASPELVDAPKQTPHAERLAKEEEEVRVLTEEQAHLLFMHADRASSRWRHYYVVAVRTGLRPGEALGLKWKDLDLDLNPASLRVRRTLDTHHAARFGPPKSRASRRTLSLHHEAAEALTQQREMLAEENLETDSECLVFPSAAGTPMSSNNLRRRHLQRHLKEADLPRRTLHELRHTYASIALHDWMLPAKIVQTLMGHENLKMTMDLYGHLMPGAEAEAMRRLNSLHRKPKESAENPPQKVASKDP